MGGQKPASCPIGQPPRLNVEFIWPGQRGKAGESGHTRGALFLTQQLFTCRGLKKGRGRGVQPGRCPSQPPPPLPSPRHPPAFPGRVPCSLADAHADACAPEAGRRRPRPGGRAKRRKSRVGVRARGGRSARLGRQVRGSRPGPPAEARRPPPAGRGARGARSPPCAAPGGPAEAGARRAGEGTPSPGPAGSRSGRADVLRRAGRAEGGRRAAARREGGEDAHQLRPSGELSGGPSQAACSFSGSPRSFGDWPRCLKSGYVPCSPGVAITHTSGWVQVRRLPSPL